MAKIIGSDQVIKRAYEALDQFGWSEPELIAYEQEIKRIWDNQAVFDAAVENAVANAAKKGMEKGVQQGIEKGMQQGIEKGKAEGIEQGKIIIARNMKSKGIGLDVIAEVTGLSVEDIEKL